MFKKWWRQNQLLGLILILALGLRLPQLAGSFWLDEAAQALESTRPWSQQLDLALDFQPPLLHLLLFLPIRISHQEWWLRTVGALMPGLVIIWASYHLAERLINQRAAVVTTLLLVTSSFHIFYSQELRPYALPAMWASLSWLYLIEALRLKKFSQSNWLGFTLCSLLGFYSSYLYPFFYLAQLVWTWWQHRDEVRKLLTSAILVVIGFLPWLPSFLEQLSAGQGVRQQLPGWENVVSLNQFKAPLLVVGKFLFGVLNLEINPFFVISSVLLLVLSGWLFYRNSTQLRTKKSQRAMKLIFSWLLIPALTSWLASFLVPVVRPKRLLFLLPAFYLIPGLIYGLTRLRAKHYHLSVALVSLLLGLNLYGTFQYHFNAQYQRENWRALHEHIAKFYPASETITLFSFPAPFAPWIWYAQQTYPTISTGELYIKQVKDLGLTIKTASGYRYVLLFDYLRDLTDPEDQLRTELWALGFREIDALDYPQLGLVRVFSRTKPTAKL